MNEVSLGCRRAHLGAIRGVHRESRGRRDGVTIPRPCKLATEKLRDVLNVQYSLQRLHIPPLPV